MNRKNNQLANQIILQYLLSLVIFIFSIPLLVLIGSIIASNITWYATDLLYQFIKIAMQYFGIIMIFVYLTGVIIITMYFIKKPLDLMGEVMQAASQLANPTDNEIILPKSLRSIEDELNLVRIQGLRNIMNAKESDQRKNDLIIYLAHDLKTPLTSIIGYLSLLKDEPNLSEEAKIKYTNIALDKAERLEYLVNEFFDITRFNLTTQILQKEKVNLSIMLEQISYEFTPLCKDKNINFVLELDSSVEYVCDSIKMERVFDNLIRNAINYSYKDSSICISMITSQNDLTIKFMNHGQTIPVEIIDRLFEQFFRLDSSRKSSTGGSGIGLAIAKEIIELHQGTISARSDHDIIEFMISLPLDR